MKYIVILGDGMSDYPIEELGAKTVLEYAKTPNFDKMSKTALIGLCKSVADDLPAGSDVANLSIMGYDPHIYHTGRSPLEALSMGVPMEEGDLSFRLNLVTLSDEERYEDKRMLDYSADEIETNESAVLIEALERALGNDMRKFYAGISYRHIMLLHGGKKEYKFTQPHDIPGKVIGGFLPKDEMILDVMKKSYDILKDHPVNLERVRRGKKPANSAWIWGEGTKPALSSFYEKFGIRGSVISAVDLIKGIGTAAGLSIVEVPGATGNINTNFEGKAQAALSSLLSGCDFTYVHIEAPDESGHRAEIMNKVKSVEKVDMVAGLVADGLSRQGIDFRMLVIPDHATPLSLRTHTHDPVPFMLYDPAKSLGHSEGFSENTAKDSGVYIDEGHKMMELLIGEKS